MPGKTAKINIRFPANFCTFAIMEKLFYSIGEVAAALDESVSTVRFWTNSFSRFVNPSRTAKGNRQYTADDLETLKQVKHLLKVRGLTLEGAQKELSAGRAGTSKQVKALESLKAIKQQLQEIKKSL